MLSRTISVMALAAVAGVLFLPNAAEAGSRWWPHFLQPHYYTYYPRPLDLYSPDYGDDEDYYDDGSPPLAYYDPQDEYYEPQYRNSGDEPAYIIPKKKKTSKIDPVVKKNVVSTEKNIVTGTSAMTCDKAGKIISGYGFTSVKPTSCAGQVFAFNATRSGKAYVIKLSAASGELTEVKKVQ